MGPRVPGTEPHDRLSRMLAKELRAHTPEVIVQGFVVPFRGDTLACANVIGVFRAKTECRGVPRPAECRGVPRQEGTPAMNATEYRGPGGVGPVLLGTHYDTRPRADRETDKARRETPIPGANDGGSGTAVLLHMLRWLGSRELSRDVIVVFFDAEDLGGIDGKEYSIGAEFHAANPLPGLRPSEATT